jgi:hypothetical protein
VGEDDIAGLIEVSAQLHACRSPPEQPAELVLPLFDWSAHEIAAVRATSSSSWRKPSNPQRVMPPTRSRRACRAGCCAAGDLLGSEDIPLTQEFLAQMLGARRTSVTFVAGTLQQAGLFIAAKAAARRGLPNLVPRALAAA